MKTEAELLRVQLTQGSEKWQLLCCGRHHNHGARETQGALLHDGRTPHRPGEAWPKDRGARRPWGGALLTLMRA